METLVDELAMRAEGGSRSPTGASLLKPEAKKLRSVLDLLDEKSSAWRNKLPPPGHALGIACHESFDTAGCVRG